MTSSRLAIMRNSNDNTPAVASPCIDICCVDTINNFCKGCFRTIEEIAAWPYLENSEKAELVAQLQARKSSETIKSNSSD